MSASGPIIAAISELERKIREDIEKLRQKHYKFEEAKVGFCLIIDRFSKVAHKTNPPEFQCHEEDPSFLIYSSIFACCSPSWCPSCKYKIKNECDLLDITGYTTCPMYFNK
ncbi:MAG: hypothetical protein ACTSQ8_13695 [Candidatus Helarchaeota archaeon]